MLTSEQLRASRAILRWDQSRLAEASGVSAETIKRLEKMDGPLASTRVDTIQKLRRILEAAGVEFIPENGGGAGVRLQVSADLEQRLSVLLTLYRSDQPLDHVIDRVDEVRMGCRDLTRLSQLFGDRVWEKPRRPADERGIAIQERIINGRSCE